ncbi:MAG: hypothetical protein M0R48_03875 [Candidatus Omnitrophica bacterium]|jgi:Flp pilus assembly pilin Flp|nr:hypothetical protein [Candidatus Omnitrophota bacterium]
MIKNNIINLKSSQTILMYAALIAAVAFGLVMISTYLQRHISGVYQQAGDAVGEGEQK